MRALFCFLSVAVLAAGCAAQSRHYDIFNDDGKLVGNETVTIADRGNRLLSVAQVTSSDGQTSKSQLEYQVNLGGSNKRALFTFWIKGQTATTELTWRGDKLKKMELTDVHGQKSEPDGPDDSGVTGSTA